MQILYDGWSLSRAPGSLAGLHLQTLLSLLPSAVDAYVALPAPAAVRLPAAIQQKVRPVSPSPSAHLVWQQHMLPALAREMQAQLIHLPHPSPALFSPVPVVVSPTGMSAAAKPRPRGLFERLRDAMAQGGMARGAWLLWPEDLPSSAAGVQRLPPAVHPAFRRLDQEPIEVNERLELPDTYIFYHGPSQPDDLSRLLGAWKWAVAPIGEQYPLLIAGLDPVSPASFTRLLDNYDLQETVRMVNPQSIEELSQLYQGCAAFFYPAQSDPWGEMLRAALLYEKPVVALETPLSGALVGPAGYLVPSSSNVERGLGAALITVIVEESVASGLAAAARRQTASWRLDDFPLQLEACYRQIIDSSK